MGWIHTDDAEDDIHFLGHYLSGHEDKDHIHSLEHQLIIIETMINLGLYIIHLLSFHNRLRSINDTGKITDMYLNIEL